MPGWYDVDDAASLRMLEDELGGHAGRLSPRSTAPTRRRHGAFLRARQGALARAGLTMQFPSGDRFVSVIIPCLNEEEPIGGVVREVLAQGVDEVIVVDNGSTDRTAERAAAAGARVVREPQRGYGRACAAGLARACRRDSRDRLLSRRRRQRRAGISCPRWSGRSPPAKPISSWARACAARASRAA